MASPVLPFRVLYSTAQGRLILLSKVVSDETIASVIICSSGEGIGFF